MRIALLNDDWYPNTGGGIVHVDALATRLARNHNCRVDILTQQRRTNERSTDLPNDVDLIQFPVFESGPRLLQELQYIVSILHQIHVQDYDVVHAHTNGTALPLQALRFFDEPATVLTVHGASLNFTVTYAGSLLDPLFTSIRRVILERFRYDGVISVSTELATVLSEYHDTIEFIPNGVAVDEFPRPSSERSGTELLFVGRLRPKKNPVDAVRAMETVIEKHPEAMLHIVGTGPLETEIKRAAVAHGVNDAVTVHGRVSDEKLNELYRQCSVLVLPSKWEGHPLVLLEAWAAGMVVVGTNVEGIREFLENNDYGTLVPLNDPDRLASAIISTLDRSAKLEAKAERIREFVREQYDWDTTASRTYDLYQRLVEDTTQSQVDTKGTNH